MNLMRRLPANQVAKNIGAVCEMIQDEDLKFDVESKVDQPLELAYDEVEGTDFL